jgi:hypothetical protein
MDNSMTPDRWRTLQQAHEVMFGAVAGSHIEHDWFHADRYPGGVHFYIPDSAAENDSAHSIIDMPGEAVRMPFATMEGQ